jgi:hypothetical protein
MRHASASAPTQDAATTPTILRTRNFRFAANDVGNRTTAKARTEMSSFHSCKTKTLPSKGIAGDAYFNIDTREIFICIADGRLVPLAGLLSNYPGGPVGADGPKGDRGEKGDAGIQGQRGENGLMGPAGADGRNGKDGERGQPGVQGLQGERGENGDKGDKGDTGATGATGPRGEQGPRGDVLIVDDAAVQAAVKKLQAAKLRIQAKIRQKALESNNLPPAMRTILQSHLAEIEKELNT